MSEIIAAVGRNRGPILRWAVKFLVGLAIVVLIGSLYSQGMGGALTTVADIPLAGAELIVLGGVPMLAVIMVARYWGYGLQMFQMGTRGQERITIFATIRGGFTVDAVIYRRVWIGILGLTSMGINIGIAYADRSIGTGPRTAFMVLCTAMAGVSVLVAERLMNQLVMRAVLIGGVVFAVALTSSDGRVDAVGLLSAGIVGLHMYAVQKGLTALGTEAFDTDEMNKKMSQRYRDIGMLLANVITFFLMLAYAGWKHVWPTPDHFEGSPLPLWILYLAVPGLIMVIPILGMNWARNQLSETWNAMLTSTAPVWGALAALMLGGFGWPNTPTLDASQWVGIGIVVLAAVGAGIDVAVRERWSKRFDQMDRELAQVYAELEAANTERERAYADRDAAYVDRDTAYAKRDAAEAERVQAGVLFREADAERREAKATCERLQDELDALIAEAQASAASGAGSVDWKSGTLDVDPDGRARFFKVAGLTAQVGDVTFEAKYLSEGSLGEGGFDGPVTGGTVGNRGRVVTFDRGNLQVRPDGSYSIEKLTGPVGATSAE
ncbi:hypothetical protein [Actinomadura sp. WMMA1423]|uniref:hypothetical protein n=1 Tax=Actinomadura sp. WMMA1423 TaxID=2591108 RepID=UPI0011469107|nr:hypothetical protein [Actinomadura sp. WMMA1423]